MATLGAPKSNCCLELYIHGRSDRSQRAIDNLRKLCRDSLPGSYEVQIIDVLERPDAAEAARVMWTPTLVKTFPRPLRRVVGDLADPQAVLQALDLPPSLLPSESSASDLGRLAYDRHANLLLGSPDGIVVLDAEGGVAFANHAAKHLLGWPEHELASRCLSIPWLDDNSTTLRLPLGEGRFAEARAAVVEWNGRVCQLLCLRDVTPHVLAEDRASSQIAELLARNDKLGRAASIDPLTNVLNRRGLQHALNEALSRSKRSYNPLSALLIDCDDFKGINDSLGHAVGDVVLKAVAESAAATLRPQDHVGRIGGDEFLVLLPNTPLAAAVQVGERILGDLRRRTLPTALAGRRVTVSIGASLVLDHMETVEQVIGGASTPLKLAKRHGKQRVVIADGAPSERSDGLHFASETEELIRDPSCLRVVSQDIVSLSTGAVQGCELLVRGPCGRFEQPRALFDVARNLGLVETLDRHCLQANLLACKNRPGVRHHINVLPATLLNHSEQDLSRLVGQQMRSSPLCLEVDQGEIVGDPSPLRGPREALRRLGIGLALDNVGFGRAALEALIMLQPDIIKTQPGLIGSVVKDRGQARDLRRLVAAARSVEIEVIAQGVETQADIDLLLEMGVLAGQGFFWGRPATLARAIAS